MGQKHGFSRRLLKKNEVYFLEIIKGSKQGEVDWSKFQKKKKKKKKFSNMNNMRWLRFRFKKEKETNLVATISPDGADGVFAMSEQACFKSHWPLANVGTAPVKKENKSKMIRIGNSFLTQTKVKKKKNDKSQV